MDIITGIRTFLVNNVPKMVIKYSRDAKRNETIESRKAADIYMSARNGTDSWITYPSFNKEIILEAANRALLPIYEDSPELIGYIKDKNLIYKKYYKYTDVFVECAREWTLRNYEEKNEYYRMLAGLPPIGVRGLFFDDNVYTDFNIPRVYMHEVDQSVLNSLDLSGILDEYQKRYPQYKYISHLGNGRIDVALARMADNFDVLYIPKKIDNDSYQRDFLRSYDRSREYMLTVVYNMYYSAKYEYYDNYLAFVTLMMAVQNIINDSYKIVVNRDFYDLESIRTLLTAYNIPYSGFFNLYQNRLLVKNLNILLQEKSTTRVLIDVMDLLGFNNYELVKYYLVKRHKTNENGMPILKYLKDADGNYILNEKNEKVLDTESIYDFYFSGVPIDSEDIQQDIINSDFIYSYEEMINDDNLWVDDNTTKKLLMETDFNYMQTKYIDVKVVYKLQEIIFETVYLSRIILDNAENTKKISVSMNLLSDFPVSLFDGIIMLICLMCKMHHMEPTILKTTSQAAYIMGFDFNSDMNAIKTDIRSRKFVKLKWYNIDNDDKKDKDINVPNVYDSNIAKYIEKTIFTTPESVNNMYVNIRELKNLLVTGMADADTLVTYNAYKRLYDSLMFTEVNNSIYKLSDGTTPDTFADYLKESNLELYNIYMECEEEMISEYIDYITQRLSTLLVDTKYFQYIKLLSGEDIDALLKLLRFFKSYTVNIRKAHINLMLDDRYDNMMHIINNMKLKVNMNMGQNVKLSDILTDMHNVIKMSDSSFEAIEKISMLVDNFIMKEYINGKHDLKFKSNVFMSSNIDNIDVIEESGTIEMRQMNTIEERDRMLAKMSNIYRVSTSDDTDIKSISRYNLHIDEIDDVNIESSINIDDYTETKDLSTMIINSKIIEDVSVVSKTTMDIVINPVDKSIGSDVMLNMDNVIKPNDKLNSHETLRFIYHD